MFGLIEDPPAPKLGWRDTEIMCAKVRFGGSNRFYSLVFFDRVYN